MSYTMKEMKTKLIPQFIYGNMTLPQLSKTHMRLAVFIKTIQWCRAFFLCVFMKLSLIEFNKHPGSKSTTQWAQAHKGSLYDTSAAETYLERSSAQCKKLRGLSFKNTCTQTHNAVTADQRQKETDAADQQRWIILKTIRPIRSKHKKNGQHKGRWQVNADRMIWNSRLMQRLVWVFKEEILHFPVL